VPTTKPFGGSKTDGRQGFGACVKEHPISTVAISSFFKRVFVFMSSANHMLVNDQKGKCVKTSNDLLCASTD
jgi:hypothetical protein